MGYPIHGKVARIEKNAVLVGSSIGFSAEATVSLVDITAQGANWKSWVAGLSEWGGNMELLFDPSNTEQKALMDNIIAATPGVVLTDVEFNLEDNADYWSGDIFIIGFTVTTNVGDAVKCSFPYKGNAAPTLTIA